MTRQPTHSQGPFKADRDMGQDPPWAVMDVHGMMLCAIHSARARNDAHRIAAALNAVAEIPTSNLEAGILTRFWLSVDQLVDLLEGKELPGIPDVEAHRTRVLAEAKALLAETSH